MKKIIFLLSFVALLTACGQTTAPVTTDPTPAPTTSATVESAQTVSIQNFAFTPKAVTVKVGDTVTWTNSDSASHTVTSDAFDSGTLASGQSFSYTFDKAGSFNYKCSIHPSMTGTVNVQ